MSCKTIFEALRKCSPCCTDDPEQPQPRVPQAMGLDVEPPPTYNSYAQAFSYSNLQNKEIIEYRNYSATRDSQFYKLMREGGDESAASVGWKIHISLDDSDPNNVSVGWNIVKDILIGSNIDYFKVVTPDVRKDQVASPSEIGRHITIYATGDPNVYPDILQRITDEFVRQGVNPGVQPIVDRPVTGSSFFYYRNDDNGEGAYVPVGRAKSYNDSGKDDPFINIRIVNNNQPPIKAKSSGALPLQNLFIEPKQ